jgi:hypothetical protein
MGFQQTNKESNTLPIYKDKWYENIFVIAFVVSLTICSLGSFIAFTVETWYFVGGLTMNQMLFLTSGIQIDKVTLLVDVPKNITCSPNCGTSQTIAYLLFSNFNESEKLLWNACAPPTISVNILDENLIVKKTIGCYSQRNYYLGPKNPVYPNSPIDFTSGYLIPMIVCAVCSVPFIGFLVWLLITVAIKKFH